MKTTLQQIETFYWVARLGGFHAAARHLHLTQPTVSARIHELEENLGVKLFERGGYRAVVTAVAHDLLVQAEKMLRLADDFELAAKGRDPMRGLLRLGVNESTAMGGLTELLGRLKVNYPDLRIELTVDVGVALSRKLNARELDIAILSDPVSAPHVIDEPLGQVELQWVASTRLNFPKHPLTAADIAALPIIVLPPPSTLNRVVVAWLRSGGCEPDNVSTCNSMSLIVQLVAAGHGISVLPCSIVQAHIDSGIIRNLPINPALAPSAYVASYLRDLRGMEDGTVIRTVREVLTQSGLLMQP